MSKRLYLFTARYPYVGVENFLEDEIQYLSRKFDEVVVVPYKNTDHGCRKMPGNCHLAQAMVTSQMDFLVKALFNKVMTPKLIREFFDQKVYSDIRRIRVWLTGYVAANSIANSSVVKKIGEDLKKDDVCYFYWGKWSNVLSVLWEGKAHFVSRFHGQWDLWEEEYGNYAPLRKKIAASLDAAVFISEKGEKYFHEHYPECNTKVFRLGTKDIGTVKTIADGKIRILSCSTVYPLKRVDLILISVAEVAKIKDVIWTHLGGGDDYKTIKSMAESMQGEHLEINMPGQMSYSEVLEYYKNHPFDIFVNLSTNEGVPVSIMEAISCDVPIVATNVGGTPEIITAQTGMLVGETPNPKEVANAIIDVFDNRKKYRPRDFWKQNYMAAKNYELFAEYLSMF